MQQSTFVDLWRGHQRGLDSWHLKELWVLSAGTETASEFCAFSHSEFSCRGNCQSLKGRVAVYFVLRRFVLKRDAFCSSNVSFFSGSVVGSTDGDLQPRKNVLIALECSTFSTLMDAAAFEMLGRLDWLAKAPGVVSVCLVVAAWHGSCCVVRCAFCQVNFLKSVSILETATCKLDI